MEALNFIRFWRPSNGGHKENRAQPCGGNSSTTEVPKALIASDHELDEGDDSFFDLELPVPEFCHKGNVDGNCREENGVNGDKRFDSKEEQPRSFSPNDNFSKRKIIPIETSSKPQYPIALLKSAPKFRVFTLRKSKSMANSSSTLEDKAELIGISMKTPKHEKQGSNKHLKANIKTDKSSNFPIFTRESSSRKIKGKTEDDFSKRLLKDLMQKYLNKIKPLSKRNSLSDKIRVSGVLPMSSPATEFSMKEKQGNLRGVCKLLGKSRSTSSASSSISRRDDSLLLQHDGIQSAILHCKKSLNSSRAESSRLSRCTSDSSQEKLSNASSTDSSLLSRVTSNSSYEKLMDSARISSEEGNAFST
ncbi:putative membrane-associated kinase regulator 5 -like protein [Gossypium arboreum]|uniref:Putative membrane-associated kinase regulator 5-like protein n=1 Tax=Gossypium arboreum TaxID=29729 RepID=A0A0B0MWY1_GOSAR|nr:membrane-associated kinase regulator 5-like isoform X1 [Gossypium arboreum]KHG04019.1 putative membrane-associated kinase regulator 5 -like protein [Gossypium arboreum]